MNTLRLADCSENNSPAFWSVRSSLFAASQSAVVPLKTSEAEINCFDPPLDEDMALCLVGDGLTTHVVEVEIGGHHVHTLGTLRGRFWQLDWSRAGSSSARERASPCSYG